MQEVRRRVVVAQRGSDGSASIGSIRSSGGLARPSAAGCAEQAEQGPSVDRSRREPVRCVQEAGSGQEICYKKKGTMPWCHMHMEPACVQGQLGDETICLGY